MDSVVKKHDAFRYINPYPDYSTETNDSFLKDNNISEKLLSAVQATEMKFLNTLGKVLPTFQTDSDHSVYTGYCGVAFLYFQKYQQTKDKEFLTKAVRLANIAVNNLKYKRISFLNGDSGPLALAIILNKLNGEPKAAEQQLERLIHINFEKFSHPDEMLYGRAGYLYSLLFVDKYHSPVIPPEHYRNVISTIILTGRRQSKKVKSESPLSYEWHDKNYFGAAHGIAGIYYVLLCANDKLTDDERFCLLKPSIDWLVKQRYPSGNFLSSEGSDRDRLVQWCHGAPGFIHLLLKAYQVFNDENYLKIANETGDIVWERGLLDKGYSICHGVSGNAYTFLALYKATKELKHLYRAACFADWCTKHPRNEGMEPDRPYSLFEGIAGIAYFLNDIQDPLNSAFPAYEI